MTVGWLVMGCAGSDDETPAELLDFEPKAGFYLINYDGWSSPDCHAYIQDRMGAMVTVLQGGADFSLFFDYNGRRQGCLSDMTVGTFTCAVETLNYDYEEDYGLDARPTVSFGLEGTWTDAENFEAVETVTLDCEGADCNVAKNYVPPYPYVNENLSFPCTLQLSLIHI